MTLIRSDTLRRAIANYEQMLARDVESQKQLEDLWLNRIAPYRYEHGVMTQPQVPGIMRDAMGPDADIRFEGLEFDADDIAYVGNRLYANLLVARLLRDELVKETHASVIESIDALLTWLPGA